MRYLFLFIFAFTISAASLAQCANDECVKKLSEGYIFLKSYKMEQVGDNMEYSYVFSKETNYMLVTCNKEGSSNNIVVTLLDSSKKPIASNYDASNDKYYSAIAYNCKATGVYYLKYTFKGKPGCCVSVLAFKK